MSDQIKIAYLGTNVGKIYLSDIGKRYQLGGGREGDYQSHSGQDRYVIWGETKVVQKSGEVLMSMVDGVLKFFSTEASSSAFTTGAPLTLTDGDYTSADEVPRSDLGATYGTRFADAYMERLANDKYAPTGASGVTGTYVGGTF